jgi:hypothetical protein
MTKRWPIWLAFVGVSSCGNAGGNDQLTDIQREYVEQMARIQFGDQQKADVRSDIIWSQTRVYLNGQCARGAFEMSIKGSQQEPGEGFSIATECLEGEKADEDKFVQGLAKESRYRQRRSSVYDIAENPDISKSPPNPKYLERQVHHTNLILDLDSRNSVKISKIEESDGFFSKNRYCSIDYIKKEEIYSILSVSIHLKSFDSRITENETDPKRISKIFANPKFAECILRANLLSAGLMIGSAKNINFGEYSPICLPPVSAIKGTSLSKNRCMMPHRTFGKYIYAMRMINPQLENNKILMHRAKYIDFLKRNIKKIQIDDSYLID